MKNALNAAKAKIGTAVQNQTQRVASARDRARTRSSGGDDGLGASGTSGVADAERHATEAEPEVPARRPPAALPPNWVQATDAAGRVYYCNAYTGEDSWTPPTGTEWSA